MIACLPLTARGVRYRPYIKGKFRTIKSAIGLFTFLFSVNHAQSKIKYKFHCFIFSSIESVIRHFQTKLQVFVYMTMCLEKIFLQNFR